MEIVNDSVELIIEEGLKKIELIGKVCTKKEHNITENSYINFVKNRIKDGHTSILAHEFVYFDIGGLVNAFFLSSSDIIYKLIYYNRYIQVSNDARYIAVSYRSLLDMLINSKRNDVRKSFINDYHLMNIIINKMWDCTPELKSVFNIDYSMIDYIPESYTKSYINDALKRVNPNIILMNAPEIYVSTFKFITNRAIANEIIRHSEIAPMQESTRYINYSKSGDTIKFIPSYNISDYVRSKETSNSIITFNEIETDGYITCEQYYKDSIEIGINQQFARDILPLGLKTELYMTGTMDMWVGESIENNINGIIIKENKGFIPQRSAKCAHPQIKRLSDKVYTLLKINYSKYYDF